MGFGLDDHTVLQEYVEHAEQGQLRPAAGPAATGESPAHLA
jgi:hypothetical protein